MLLIQCGMGHEQQKNLVHQTSTSEERKDLLKSIVYQVTRISLTQVLVLKVVVARRELSSNLSAVLLRSLCTVPQGFSFTA